MRLICMSVSCLMTLIISSNGEQTTKGTRFTVTPEYSPSSETSSYKDVAAAYKLVCAIICSDDRSCLSAVYDEANKVCSLYSSLLQEQTTTGSPLVLLKWYMEVYEDCQDVFENGKLSSGMAYKIQPAGSTNSTQAVCEFNATSGWTVIQRRLDGSVDFYMGWNDYVNGFGDVNGEYWLGLDNIYYLTKVNRKLHIYLGDHNGESKNIYYTTFYIHNETDKYRLTISGYSGEVGDAFTRVNGQPFTTFDADNDAWVDGVCAVERKGAWWYKSCQNYDFANLNGKYYPTGSSGGPWDAAFWYTWRTWTHSFKTIYMKITK